ncbi:vegetative incompatibility protein HET-E-1 [Podospora australis]|uniref:Vegetative incompatibility protein HET-E-1 n=1 Tax=Podospora australis TaxID=1536484 RepID=A0AAN6WKD7_9PEZI|nr:vegetative incompatibility protein HET-E-1 [Podospora australis]
MKLLTTASPVPVLKDFISEPATLPPYAILSHTWEDEEVSFQELMNPIACMHKKGYEKIVKACEQARRDGFKYAWVDTCCVNKEASAELEETINSMFHWYEEAAVCYVFLPWPWGLTFTHADLVPDANGDIDLVSALPKCRWFVRGWTLQELIAPKDVRFYDSNWEYRGNKSDLAGLVESITNIPETVLRKEVDLSTFSAACKMSWASQRTTTRTEDEAYCLVGIFGVEMSFKYGERKKAFTRLQNTILVTSGDLSILCWTDKDMFKPGSGLNAGREYSGALADSPQQFERCAQITTTRQESMYKDVDITPRRIQMRASLAALQLERQFYQPVLNILCTLEGKTVGIFLRKIGDNRYVRWYPALLALFQRESKKSAWGAFYLPVEQLSLPLKLESPFPFHDTDPVLGNRHSALRIASIDVGDTGFRLYRTKVFPQTHWDRHDQIFFSTSEINNSWAVILLDWKLWDMVDGKDVDLRIGIACFNWNLAVQFENYETQVFVFDVSSIDPAAFSAFEFNMDKVWFESASALRRLLAATGFGLEEDQLRSQTTLEVPMYRTTTAVVDVYHGVETRPDLCVHPMTRLYVKVRLAEEGHVRY